MALKNMIDIDGSEAVSKVLLTLLNAFPGLDKQEIKFSTLGEAAGIGFFPTSGAALLTDKTDITGHVMQVCLYPFNIIYRAAPKTEVQKLRIKEFLDTLGKWLEQQPVTIEGKVYKLSSYPDLASDNRLIKSISRTNSAHLAAAYNDGTEDWIISCSLKYENEFYK